MNCETKSAIDSLIAGQICTFENVNAALQMVIPQKLAEFYPGNSANETVCLEMVDEIMDEVAAQREHSLGELL